MTWNPGYRPWKLSSVCGNRRMTMADYSRAYEEYSQGGYIPPVTPMTPREREFDRRIRALEEQNEVLLQLVEGMTLVIEKLVVRAAGHS
jgi:hypothetical protein